MRHLGIMILLFALLAVLPVNAADPVAPQAPFVVPLDPDGVQRATITLDSYSYTPGHLIVEAGKPVELTLTSVTTIVPHNFIIKEVSVEHDVRAGNTAVAKFTPTQTGIFAIYCDKRLWPLPSHRDKGMEGKLEVK